MTPISIGRIAIPFLALTAACGAAFVSGFPRERQPPVETRAAATATAVAPLTAGVGDAGSDALAMAPALAVPPPSPDSGDEIMPVFDIALVGRAGDAVIAGTAAPGATVELLRNGEPHDRAVANQLGQFVMVPPRLPPGDYELTLRSRQPNGNYATSRRSVAVAVQPSLTDQNITPDKASVVLSKPVVPSAVRHPPRARREATGPAAQDLSGLRRKLFNHLVAPHH